MRRSLLLFIATSCTAARIDARIRPGVQLGAGVGAIQPRSGGTVADVAVHGGYGWRVGDGAFSVEAESLAGEVGVTPLAAVPSVVDLYYQAAPFSDGQIIAGVGAEVGVFASVYGVLTYAPSEDFFVTATGRLRYAYLYNAVGTGDFMPTFSNMQLAAGIRLGPSTSVGAYVGYGLASGPVSTTACLGSCGESTLGRDFVLAGLQLIR
jgi:hypothetical protein